MSHISKLMERITERRIRGEVNKFPKSIWFILGQSTINDGNTVAQESSSSIGDFKP